MRELTPQHFLRDLGITKRPEFEPNSREWDAAVRQAGVDPDSARGDDGFGPAAGNIFFADARVGRATLSHNFDRYLEHLIAFRGFRRFPPRKPDRIADLGGGAGIVAMYLARQYPQAEVIVYDWAERPLSFGRQLAEAQGIPNIRFELATFENLASASGMDVQPSELVLLYHALPLHADPPPGTFVYSYKETFDTVGVCPAPRMIAAAAAVSRLLRPDGLGIVTGGWTPWGAVHFFSAIRQTNLGIDWTRSFMQGRVKRDVFEPQVGYAFLRPDVPMLARDAWEDAQGFFSSGEFQDSKMAFSVGAAEAFSGLFEGGRELVTATANSEAYGERLRLLCKSGLLYLEHSSTSGQRRACIQSLAALQVMTDRARVIAGGWKQLTGSTPRRHYDPALLAVSDTQDPLLEAGPST